MISPGWRGRLPTNWIDNLLVILIALVAGVQAVGIVIVLVLATR